MVRVDAEQLLVLGLLILAFVAGWIARGSQAPAPATEPADDAPAPPAPPPPARPAPTADPVAEADAALERTRLASRAAEAVAPVGGRAAEAALGVLDRRLDELEDWVDRLERELGSAEPRFVAFDREVDVLHGVRRRLSA
jgi:hypothetical protein